jgi:hypothetical protein
MNHQHRKVLHAIFTHPVSANISFKDVTHVLEALGAEIDNRSGRRVGVKLRGHAAAFSHAQHSLPTDEVSRKSGDFSKPAGSAPISFRCNEPG